MSTRLMRPGEGDAKPGLDWSYVGPAGGYTNKTTDVALVAAVAGQKNYIVSLQIAAGVALATASELVVKDGSTVVWRMSLPAAVIQPTTINFDPPLRGSVNSALNAAAVTLFATGNLSINAQGYTV